MNLPVLLVLVSAAAGAVGTQPNVRFTVEPAVIKGGEEVVVSIPPFGSQRMICSAYILGADCVSDEQPCGTQRAVLRMTPTVLSYGKVTVGLNVCTGSPRANNPNTECRAYEKNIDSGLRRTAVTPATGAPAPAPAPVPSPGGLGDNAAPPLLRGAPAAPNSPAPAGATRWTAADPSPSTRRRFRGHDGRMYEREDPPKDAPADADERFHRALADDPLVRSAYDNWKNLDDGARRTALQRVADIEADVYGVAPSQVLLGRGGPATKVAHYSPADRNLTINASSPYYNNPRMQIGAVTHESRHRWQHTQVQRLPSLPPGGEERALATAFKDGFDHYCSPIGRPSCDYATYRNQLVERDAFEHGEAAADEMSAR